MYTAQAHVADYISAVRSKHSTVIKGQISAARPPGQVTNPDSAPNDLRYLQQITSLLRLPPCKAQTREAIVKSNELIQVKRLKQQLAHSKYFINVNLGYNIIGTYISLNA